MEMPFEMETQTETEMQSGMDSKICSWILHFLARKRKIGFPLLTDLIEFLAPSEDDLLLKKLVLLRTILYQLEDQCDVNEITLESLELLEGFDSLLGLSPSPFLVEAFRAVAVECTVRHLHLHGSPDGNNDYVDSLQCIWRGKIGLMEQEEADQRSSLLTDELFRWRTRLEAALHDQAVRQELLLINTNAEALSSVRAYVDYAWAGLGPSFLDILAKFRKRKQPCPKDNISPDQAPPSSGDGEKVQQNGPAKTIKVPRSCRTRGVRITDSEELGFEMSLPSVAATKAHEGLKSSYLELQEEVKEAHPDALQKAKSPMSLRSDKCIPNPNVGKAANAADASLKETVLIVVEKSENQHSSSRQLPKHSLMECNSTARTYEWDESQDSMELEGEASSYGRSSLRSLRKRRAALPLIRYDAKKFSSRRPKKRWTALEEDTLIAGIKRFGQGNWKLIHDSYPDIFEGRTSVDLKDKWRNIMANDPSLGTKFSSLA